MQTSIDAYNLTVMTAVGEVDNAMASYESALETLEITSDLLAQSREALALSVDQYKQGLSAFTNVVDAQIDVLNAANSMATAKGNALIAIIDLYKALGGSPNPQ
jgi:multidrug efflux system outer membrane protein